MNFKINQLMDELLLFSDPNKYRYVVFFKKIKSNFR
jgi:hypothetical protein